MEEVNGEKNKFISRREWRFVVLVLAAISAFTASVFIYGYLNAPEGTYFSGIHSLAPGDYSVYFSYLIQSGDGHVLFRDLYTTETDAHNMLNTFWLLVGWSGAILKLHPQVAFHLFRILSIFILGWAMYLFVSYIFPSERKRKISFLLLCLSGGVGAYVAPLFSAAEYSPEGYLHKPMDLWVAESNAFLSMLHSGHMALSTALTFVVFFFFMRGVTERRRRLSVYAGLAGLALVSFHPFQVPVVTGVVVSYIAFRCLQVRGMARGELVHGLIIGAIMLPGVLYYIYMLANDPVTAARSAQNNNLTPAWYLLFISFGPALIFAVWEAFRFFGSRDRTGGYRAFMCVWLVSQTLLIYAPVNFQRRMVEGLFFPVIVLFVMSLPMLWRRLSSGLRRIILNPVVMIYAFVAVFAMSNLYVLGRDAVMYQQQRSVVYLDNAVIEPVLRLREITDDQSVIAAEINISHFIPGLIGRAVYAGHEVETNDFENKEKELSLFFLEDFGEKSSEDFVRDNGITHILYGPRDWVGDERWKIEAGYAEELFRSAQIRALRVAP